MEAIFGSFDYVISHLPSFTTAVYIVSLLFILKLVYEGRDSRSTFAWIFLILLLPFFGLIAYLLFGRKGLVKSRKRMKEDKLMDAHLERLLADHHSDQDREKRLFKKRGFFKKYSNTCKLASHNSEALLSSANRVKMFYDGASKFESMYQDIKKAKKFVHMAYYIWRDDELSRSFVNLLELKVKEGVEVRILIDYMGSFFLSRGYVRKLRKRGIRVQFFSAMYSSSQFHTINYRNHMKNVIIDGEIAYSGGMNMGQEYVNGGRHKSWRDTHFRVLGESASIYNALFLVFWHRVTREKFVDEKYFSTHAKIKGSSLQVIGSGIDVNWSSMENLILNLIINARKSVHIQTPYFIPSDGILSALKIAALSGVKVNLMVTGVPDKLIPYWSAFNYFPELVEAGVRVYHYNKGFMHSKILVVDQEVSIVGSTNIDIRSFKLNYELGTIFYDFRISRDIVRQFNKDLDNSKRLSRNDLEKISFLAKFRNSFFRLFAPLL